MTNLAAYHLRPLTWILFLAIVVVLTLSLLPQLSDSTIAELRLAVIGFSGAVLALGLWAIRQANRRLAKLVSVAQAIEHGDYAMRAEVSGGDSIADLSVAVNRMAQRTEGVVRDLQEREREVLRLSTHDPLTGLASRRLFHELLLKELAHSRRSERKLGVILVDLDGFKNINDSLGHEWGDRVLQEVTQRLTSSTRAADTLARLGGDEFALVVSNATAVDDLREVVGRLREIFESPYQCAGQELRLSASAGISVFPDHAETPELLVGHAESALRWAKERGGKSWQVFEPFMDRKGAVRLKLEQDFHRALNADQLQIHYQPMCDLSDGTVVGCEALVRWQHPEEGLLKAGRFIPMLEEAGLMPQLGVWILGEICRQNRAWQAAGLQRVPISVNVSVRQFQAGDMPELVLEALRRSELDAEFLQLEITESIAMHDIGRMTEQLQRCHRIGVRIHLDDFGTGYSSLSYLMRFPVDVLKIDRSFVSGVPENPHSVAIVKATVALAESLDLAVIAEGVETVHQLHFLREVGCRAAQGYLIAKPMPATEIEALLAQGHLALAS